MPVPILTEKNLECDLLGDKIMKDHHPLLLGLQPIKEEYQTLCRDSLILVGKLQFYQTGFIFVDQRQGAYVVPYEDCDEIKFHLTGDQAENWMEVCLNAKGRNKMPNNLIAEPRFFLMVPYDFCTQRIAKFTKHVEKEQQKRKAAYDEAVALAKQEYDE
jgi:hypothetical protein